MSISNDIGLSINFTVAYRYTNFSINVYSISSTRFNEEREQIHEVKIYRYWAYDPSNNIPTESSYFFKMIQIINFNNSLFTKPSKFESTKKSDYPTNLNVSNYVINSK